jgi:hydroxymethylbilane synthase
VGDMFVPAPGQGALLVQARAGDRAVADALNASALGACALDPGAAAAALGAAAHDRSAIDDPAARGALLAEREVAARLGASCNTAIGVHAGDGVVRAFAGLPDGSEWLIDEAAEPALLAERLLAAGAADLLARAEAMSA